ncbi:tetratricopeptide repeat protein [uncultured Lacinutrix sp.]|uniref:tetratricopeptide repeat protein n=1 Tax=uncultured Lacinutrix sp. TaxID=574032 RepID=UPI00260E748E|nr:tetratricopeptide repeat protein [uncultured Lacinutrix sp.]
MEKTFPFFLLFFILSITPLFAQKKSNISTDSLYILSKNDSLHIKQQLNYINQALLSNENASKKLKYQSRKVAIFYSADDEKNAILEAYKLLKNAKAIKDTLYIAKAYYKLGLNYNNIEIKDSAYVNFYNSKKYFLSIKDTLNVVKSLKNLSDITRINGDFYTAEKLAVDGLKLIGAKNQELSYKLYMQLGICSNNLGDYESAKKWYSDALKIAKNKKDSANTYNSFGVMSQKKKNYNKALQFFDLALKDSLKPKLKLKIEDNKAFTKGLLNNKNAINKIDSIKNEKLKLNYYIDAYASNIHLTKLHLKLNNYNQAKIKAEAAYKIANKLNSADSKIESLGFLIDIKKNNNKEARLFKRLVDSVNRAKTKLKSTIDKIEFETFEKEKENLQLRTDKAKQAELLAKESNKKDQLIYIVSIVALFSLLLVYYLHKRQKQLKIEQYKYNQELNRGKRLREMVQNLENRPQDIEGIEDSKFHKFIKEQTGINNDLLVVYLELVKGKSYNEIAKSINLSLSGAKTRIVKLYEALKIFIDISIDTQMTKSHSVKIFNDLFVDYQINK